MKRLVRWCIATAIIAGVILVLGDARDPWLWGYIATFSLIGAYAMYAIDDDLAKERFTPPSKGADRLSLAWVRAIAAAHIIVGIADSRFGWTSVPDVLRGVGLIGFALSFMLIVRAMLANRFFSAVVRIQDDRGHHVVDTRSLFRRTTPGIRRDDRLRAAERAGARVVAQRRRRVRLLGTGRPACSLRRSVLENEPRGISGVHGTRTLQTRAWAFLIPARSGQALRLADARSGQDEAATLEAPVA